MQVQHRKSKLTLELLETRLLLNASTLLPVVEQFDLDASELNTSELWVMIGDGAAKSLTYTDSDGSVVKVKPKNLTADIKMVGDNISLTTSKKGINIVGQTELSEILLLNNHIKSQLSFSVKGGADNLTSIKSISGTGNLGKLNLKNVIVDDGEITIDNGYIGKTVVSGLRNGSDIIMSDGNMVCPYFLVQGL